MSITLPLYGAMGFFSLYRFRQLERGNHFHRIRNEVNGRSDTALENNYDTKEEEENGLILVITTFLPNKKHKHTNIPFGMATKSRRTYLFMR